MKRVLEWIMAKIFHRDTVSAAVGIVDGVQRLVQIAYKVDEVTDGFGPLQRIGGLVLKDSALLFNGARHASFRTAVLTQLSLVFPPRNIDVMPGAVLAFVAHVIRPCRGIHHEVGCRIATPASQFRIDGALAKKFLDHLLSFRCQVLLRDCGHGLMTLAPPRLGSRRSEQAQEADSNPSCKPWRVGKSPQVTSHGSTIPIFRR